METMRTFRFLASIFTVSTILLLAKSGFAESNETQKTSPPCTVEQDGPENGSSLLACNGVIKPPSVGDLEMLTEPPRMGTMPIIKPEDLEKRNNQ